ERKLPRELELDAAAHRPAGMHGGALRDHAERVVAKAGLYGAGGEAAFDVREPSIEAVADAAGHRPEPRELRRPHIGRRDVKDPQTACLIPGLTAILRSRKQTGFTKNYGRAAGRRSRRSRGRGSQN